MSDVLLEPLQKSREKDSLYLKSLYIGWCVVHKQLTYIPLHLIWAESAKIKLFCRLLELSKGVKNLSILEIQMH